MDVHVRSCIERERERGRERERERERDRGLAGRVRRCELRNTVHSRSIHVKTAT